MNAAGTLTPEIILVLGLLFLTVFLFVSEIVRIDVAAVSIMVALGLSTMLPGIQPIIDSTELFDGFSSNAVMSIIAVMIIGAGLDKTGIIALPAGGKPYQQTHDHSNVAPAYADGILRNSGWHRDHGWVQSTDSFKRLDAFIQQGVAR